MEIIIVEPKTLQQMEALMEQLKTKVNRIAGRTKPKRLEQWVDIEYVCLALNISKRTLQSHREHGMPYTQIKHKIFYRPQEVEAFILKNSESINRKKLSL